MFDRITEARFTALDESGATVEFTARRTDDPSVALVSDGKTIAVAKSENGKAVFTALDESTFDFSRDYELWLYGASHGTVIKKSGLFDTVAFMDAFESEFVQDLELGAIYTHERTVFRLWAPLASEVRLNIYLRGEDGHARAVYRMKKLVHDGKFCGVWELALSGTDFDGVYYTYSVKNYGTFIETVDPYAKACGANGVRGMVVDLERTNPVGWEDDRHIYETNKNAADIPVVWEVHVSDFSASPDSGAAYKGKYLAFAERGTTVPGTDIKTCVDHLVELGVTYVQLNPVYDFATVDETTASNADDTKDAFNWGYDPQNYNVPEGSYATDASDGTRITEFKTMVKALHDAGIGVIMDVVYNHTYAVGGQSFDDTVPAYYHRTDERGEFTNGSGCGNETASERAMVRKFITESVLYWATEYHIDGFRFDLMGVHDLDTLKTVRAELDKLYGGNGKRILTYGEPWSADGPSYVPPSFTARVSASEGRTGKYSDNADNELIKCMFGRGDVSKLPARVAVFNGDGRDGLRGNNDPGRGWINGNPKDFVRVQKLLEGGAGASGCGLTTCAGAQNVAYASAHDNYTLWDQMIGKRAGTETPLYYSDAMRDPIAKCKTVSAAYLLSSGIPFMLAGEEMGRTKFGNHNSYNSPVKLNMIEWARVDEFADLVDHFKRVIKIRKAYGAEFFSYEKSADREFCYGDFTGTTDDGVIRFARRRGDVELVCVFNPLDTDVTVEVPSGMHVYVPRAKKDGVIELAPKSCVVMGTKKIDFD